MKDILNIKQNQTLLKFSVFIKPILYQVSALVSGFLAAKTRLVGGMYPIGPALVAALPVNYALSGGLGTFLGFLLQNDGSFLSFRYIAALFAIVSIKMLIASIKSVSENALWGSLIALLASLLTGFVTLGSTDFLDTSVFFAEALLVFGFTYFLYKFFSIKLVDAVGLSKEDLVSTVVALDILLLMLTPINIGGISLGRILGIAIILAAGRFGRISAGAVAGVATGFAAALSSPSPAVVLGIFAAGGLFSAVFSSFNRFFAAAALLIVSFLTLLVFEFPSSSTVLFIESLLGSVVFISLAKPVSVKLAALFSPETNFPSLEGLRRSLVMRLTFASEALSDVSNTVDAVSESLRKIDTPKFEDMLLKVECAACKGCSLRTVCWEKERDDTLSLMRSLSMSFKARNFEHHDRENELSQRCLRPQKLLSAFDENYYDYTSRLNAENRIKEVRSVISDQFCGISNMLSDLATEFRDAEQYDIALAEKIASSLKEIGIISADCGCCIDRFSRMTVEIHVRNFEQSVLNKAQIIKCLENICERTFDPPLINKIGGEIFITASERANFVTEIGVSQIVGGGNNISGDAYDYFCDGKGRKILLLCDGMGTGARAAVDGAMTSGLMARLIKAGFGFDCSLRIVNSAMLFKSTEETFSTVDIASVDLFTGKVDLYKAGAAPTIIRRNGRTGKAESRSLPTGILRDVGFDHATITLREGDIVLLMSDGATQDGTDWISAELEAFSDGTAQQLSERIASAALRRRSDGQKDDITVMALLLQKKL